MKIIIFGAAGAMAAVVMRDLLEFNTDVSITAADMRKIKHSDPRVHPVTADVRDEDSTTKLISGHDAVLNCVTYYLNVPVMRAALRAHVPYTDLGGLYHGSKKQFELHDEFVRGGVPAVLGMGSTPGITNVMAGALAKQFDEVHEAHVRVACMDESASGPLPIPYALDTVLDEFALEPWVFTKGEARPVPPMSGGEVIDFPQPVGRAEALYTLHSEVAMFARSFPKLREASFKVAFPQEFTRKVKFLVELGFASRDKVVRDVSPREMLLSVASQQPQASGDPKDCDVLRVYVSGLKGGREKRAMAESIIFPHPQWKFGAGALDTGVPLAITGQLLAHREITTPGVLCPETSMPFQRFFEELQKRGITVNFQNDI